MSASSHQYLKAITLFAHLIKADEIRHFSYKTRDLGVGTFFVTQAKKGSDKSAWLLFAHSKVKTGRGVF